MNALGIDPVHDTRATFRALVDAMSRPGTVQDGSATPMDHAVVSTLVDHEVGIRTDDTELEEALAAEGRLTKATFDTADIVHVSGDTDGRIRDVRRGTLKEPSDGATVIYRIDELTPEGGDERTANGATDPNEDDEPKPVNGPTAEPRNDRYCLLELSGPGVPGTQTLGVAGLATADIDAIADAGSTFPRGIDVVLTTERRVAAVPRSADVEVV